ncbi:MAG: type II toxin-antitoxin system Phd/YefM family antitoxin [Candidatus Limnocylindria bacterium]
MKTATITQAKNGLSALIDHVRNGETVLITDRGIAVARIEPVASHPDATDRLLRLERAGILRRGLTPPPVDLISQPAPALRAGTSVLDALIDERRTGR